MKQISLWTVALVSALFIIMVCVDQDNWKLLSEYAVILAVWMLIGWFWIHRKDLSHDFKVLFNGESPLKCRWIGTLVLFAVILLGLFVLFVWLVWLIGVWIFNILPNKSLA